MAEKNKYTKAQLEYLEKRVDRAIEDATSRFNERFPEPDEITDEEKYMQICNGTAKPKPLAQFTEYGGDAFDKFTGYVEPREEARKEWDARAEKFEKTMALMKEQCMDMIYLGTQEELFLLINTIRDMS